MKILLADDHAVFREGLRVLLEREPGYQVIGEADNGLEACKAVQQSRPNLVLMDISMPELNGIDATQRILSMIPETRILILSMHSDRNNVLEAFRAGAMGFLVKECAYDEIIRAISNIKNGHFYLSSQVSNAMVKEYVATAKRADTCYTLLTAREREILQQLAEGKKVSQIADNLNIGAKTVETHRRNIMMKLDASSITELVKYAIREGLVQF